MSGFFFLNYIFCGSIKIILESLGLFLMPKGSVVSSLSNTVESYISPFKKISKYFYVGYTNRRIYYTV